MTIRQAVKRMLKTLFLIIVWPLYFLYRALSLIGDRDGTFQAFSQLTSLVPGKVGIYIRAAFYRLACTDTSDDISIGFLTLLSHWDTTIREGVYIGPQCNIGKCTIGKNTLIGSGVHILSGSRQHNFEQTDLPIKQQGGHFEKVTIGEDCWIGNGSIVMVDMDSQTILAAGSVATKPIPGTCIAAGNPAKVIRSRGEPVI